MKKTLNDQREKRQRLVDEVERLASPDAAIPFFDVVDDDVLGYVDDLVRSCTQIGPMAPLSLKTPKEALQALTVIERTQAAITSHLKTARALRALINTREESTLEPQ